ncbi:hypothetical protein [Clostridium botulinum]|uniref:hypothetical protein n=1 Tax=Clostridium botulinum TaxID=1491 RepID=UPI001E51552E|nr:hypothetical protein [Clostridium botulinum]MCD3223777.1 hypothetical protein [Clostridium botulinum C/D]MCD3297163.1 hypothetical protein [Clostridium botulinum C/D]
MGIARYILNFDELTLGAKDNIIKIVKNKVHSGYKTLKMKEVEKIINEIDDLMPTLRLKKINYKIKEYLLYKYNGIQKNEGILLDIPPIKSQFKHRFLFDKDIYITGITINQTGWKVEDRFDLLIDKEVIIKNSTLKEMGEHKYFNTYVKANALKPIFFVLKNNSGNSRQVLFNLEYLDGDKISKKTDSKIPTVDDIQNDWDYAVQLDWGKCEVDLDLHAFFDKTHIGFNNKEGRGVFLNFDFLEHVTNENPEILSIKKCKDNEEQIIKICVNNYNKGELPYNPTLKVFTKGVFGTRLLRTYTLDLNDLDLKEICSIDLKNNRII